MKIGALSPSLRPATPSAPAPSAITQTPPPPARKPKLAQTRRCSGYKCGVGSVVIFSARAGGGACAPNPAVMSLQHAKESKVLDLLKKLDENDRSTQAVDLSGSTVFREKSVKMCASLADALGRNTRMTSLNLSNCSIGDVSAKQIAAAIRDNATLFDLNLSYNKLGRPGLIAIGHALGTNVGLKSISLANHRVDSSVAQAYVQMFYTNVTLLTLTWDVNQPAFNLKLTEMINRNNEINR